MVIVYDPLLFYIREKLSHMCIANNFSYVVFTSFSKTNTEVHNTEYSYFGARDDLDKKILVSLLQAWIHIAALRVVFIE